MKQFKFLIYKGFEITRETYKSQIIYKAYKYGNLIEKQRYIYYNDNEALKAFKETLNANYL
jgi:hypothetical protein